MAVTLFEDSISLVICSDERDPFWVEEVDAQEDRMKEIRRKNEIDWTFRLIGSAFEILTNS
jgi:putative NADH-flavin reductase